MQRHSVLRRFASLAACVLALATAQPARAQTITYDPTNYANNLLLKLQAAWSSATNSMGQYMQSLVSTMVADTAAQNAKTLVDANNAAKVGMDHYMPTQYSACRHAQAAIAGREVLAQTQQVALALARGGSARMNDQGSNAKMIATEMALGLAPCSPPSNPSNGSDPDQAMYAGLKCTQQFGGRWEGADTSMEALFGYEQFRLPPNFPKPVNGVYQDPQPVTDETYMPAISALLFCKHLTPRIPQGLNVPQGAPPTTALLTASSRTDMRSMASSAYSDCMTFFAERLQLGQGVDPSWGTLQQSMKDRCTADMGKNFIDTTQNNDCQTNGRSPLQMMKDEAYRDGSMNYQKVYRPPFTSSDNYMEDAQLVNSHQAYQDYVRKEREQLVSAIQSAHMATMVGFNPMDMPVQKSP